MKNRPISIINKQHWCPVLCCLLSHPFSETHQPLNCRSVVRNGAPRVRRHTSITNCRAITDLPMLDDLPYDHEFTGWIKSPYWNWPSLRLFELHCIPPKASKAPRCLAWMGKLIGSPIPPYLVCCPSIHPVSWFLLGWLNVCQSRHVDWAGCLSEGYFPFLLDGLTTLALLELASWPINTLVPYLGVGCVRVGVCLTVGLLPAYCSSQAIHGKA